MSSKRPHFKKFIAYRRARGREHNPLYYAKHPQGAVRHPHYETVDGSNIRFERVSGDARVPYSFGNRQTHFLDFRLPRKEPGKPDVHITLNLPLRLRDLKTNETFVIIPLVIVSAMESGRRTGRLIYHKP